MIKFFFFLLTMILTIFNVACKKSDENVKIKIEGFHLFDGIGNPMGRIGPVDNDWQFINWSSLSSFEQSLLNSTDDINTTNTSVSTVSFHPYPNPVKFVSAFSSNAADSVKLKVVIVDESGTILRQLAQKIKGSTPFHIDVSDRSIFPSKKSLRYYYSFSATNNLHFKVGYGDIKICDYLSGQDRIEDCFK